MRLLGARAVVIVSLTAALAASSTPAAASGFTPEGVFVPVGVTIAGATHGHGSGFVLGAEASAVYFRGGWVGGYVDAVRDFGADAFRISTGPEIGLGPIGVDFGYVGSIDDAGGYRHGWVGRGMLTVSLVAVYGRYVTLFGEDGTAERFGELGAMIKFPIPVHTPKRVAPASPEREAETKPLPAAKPVAGDPPPEEPAP